MTDLENVVQRIFASIFGSPGAVTVEQIEGDIFLISFDQFLFRFGTDLGTSNLFSFFTHARGLEEMIGSGFNAYSAADFFYFDESFIQKWNKLRNTDINVELRRVGELIFRIQRLDDKELDQLAHFVMGHQFGYDAQYRS